MLRNDFVFSLFIRVFRADAGCNYDKVVVLLVLSAAALAVPRPSSIFEEHNGHREDRASKGFHTAHVDVSKKENEDVNPLEKEIIVSEKRKQNQLNADKKFDLPEVVPSSDPSDTEYEIQSTPAFAESLLSDMNYEDQKQDSFETHILSTEAYNERTVSDEIPEHEQFYTETTSEGNIVTENIISPETTSTSNRVGHSKYRNIFKAKINKQRLKDAQVSKSINKTTLPKHNLHYENNVPEKINRKDSESTFDKTSRGYSSSYQFPQLLINTLVKPYDQQVEPVGSQQKTIMSPIRRQIFQQQTVINPYYRQYTQQLPYTPYISRLYYTPQDSQQIPFSSNKLSDNNYQHIHYPLIWQQSNPLGSEEEHRIVSGKLPNYNDVFQAKQDLSYGNTINKFTYSTADPKEKHSNSFISHLTPQNLVKILAPYKPFTDSISPGLESDSRIYGFMETQKPVNSGQSRVSWPFSDYFPIVINDPFLSMYNAFTNVVEYGPEADVCKYENKAERQSKIMSGFDDVNKMNRQGRENIFIFENGKWKVLKQENVSRVEKRSTEEEKSKEDDSTTKIADASGRKDSESIGEENTDVPENFPTEKPTENAEIIMTSGNAVGGSGPYVTKLVVRKGGVSIAGPGGIATAGSGGTAIVGPGGVAYTSPNGLAVVGPGGKVVGLPTGVDVVLGKVTSGSADGSQPRMADIPPGGRIVATGPTIYFHPAE